MKKLPRRMMTIIITSLLMGTSLVASQEYKIDLTPNPLLDPQGLRGIAKSPPLRGGTGFMGQFGLRTRGMFSNFTMPRIFKKEKIIQNAKPPSPEPLQRKNLLEPVKIQDLHIHLDPFNPLPQEEGDKGKALKAPQQCRGDQRIWAAQNLSTLGEAHQDQAAKAYLSLAADEDIDVYKRIKLAKNLAALWKEHEGKAIDILLNIATKGALQEFSRKGLNRPGFYQAKAARVLSTFGKESKDKAAKVLASITTNEEAHIDDRIDAATTLSKWGEDYGEIAAIAHLSIATSKTAPVYHRIYAVHNLCMLGEENQKKATDILFSIAMDKNTRRCDKIQALKVLAPLGKDEEGKAAQIYLLIATDQSAPSFCRINAANALDELGEEYADAAAESHFLLAMDPKQDSSIQIEAANALAKGEKIFQRNYTNYIAQAYSSISMDKNAMDRDRIKASSALSSFGYRFMHRKTLAAKVCLAFFKKDPCAHIDAAKALCGFGEEFQTIKDEAIEILLLLIKDKDEDLYLRIKAASILGEFRKEYEAKAILFLLKIIKNKDLDPFYRSVAAGKLFQFGPEYKDAQKEALHTLLSMNENAQPHDQEHIQEALAQFRI